MFRIYFWDLRHKDGNDIPPETSDVAHFQGCLLTLLYPDTCLCSIAQIVAPLLGDTRSSIVRIVRCIFEELPSS